MNERSINEQRKALGLTTSTEFFYWFFGLVFGLLAGFLLGVSYE